jgi:hypothetical protein
MSEMRWLFLGNQSTRVSDTRTVVAAGRSSTLGALSSFERTDGCKDGRCRSAEGFPSWRRLARHPLV